MNLLLIVAALFLLCKVVDGYKKGMVKEIISFVSLVILCVVLTLIANGVNSYFDGEYAKLVMVVVLLVVLGLVHHLLGVLFFSAKMIVKLPIVHWLDKVLGIVVGILETVLIIWTIYTFIMLMDLGAIGQQILIYTEESEILLWFYQHNYLAYLLEHFSSEISLSLPSF